MSAATVLERFACVIDEHRWDDLAELLHVDFVCHYVHTGETFDREAWIVLNKEYPGFQRFLLRDLIATADRAAIRAHVTGVVESREQHFEVASFVSVRDGLIAELTEVWTDVDVTPPAGTRPVAT